MVFGRCGDTSVLPATEPKTKQGKRRVISVGSDRGAWEVNSAMIQITNNTQYRYEKLSTHIRLNPGCEI